MLSKLKWFNLTLRGGLEAGIIIALSYWGFKEGDTMSLKLFLGIGTPLLGFGFWGLVDFRNIIAPTPPIEPPLGKNTLWKLLSHLSLNYLSFGNSDNIKNLLKLYIFPGEANRARAVANQKRIEGILDFVINPVDRLKEGFLIRGQKVRMTARQDYYASLGDLYLFSSVMDLFLGVYSSINTCIQFELKDSISGETFLWPDRLGDKPLI